MNYKAQKSWLIKKVSSFKKVILVKGLDYPETTILASHSTLILLRELDRPNVWINSEVLPHVALSGDNTAAISLDKELL